MAYGPLNKVPVIPSLKPLKVGVPPTVTNAQLGLKPAGGSKVGVELLEAEIPWVTEVEGVGVGDRGTHTRRRSACALISTTETPPALSRPMP